MNQVAQERGRPIDGLEHLIGDSPIITVTMAGVNLECLVDTGSQVTLANESFYLAHLQPRGHKLTTVRNWLTIRAADGLELPYLGYFETDIVLAGTTVSTELCWWSETVPMVVKCRGSLALMYCLQYPK